MRYLIISLVIVLLTVRCSNEMGIYDCKGIPDEDQSFSFMYFKNKEEGYLFGTLKYFQEMSETELNNPNFNPKSTTEANIYKTNDGGRNWIKIDSIPHFSYHTIGTSNDKKIYLLMSDTRDNFKNNIVSFDLENEKLDVSKSIKTISSLWVNDKNLFYSNNRGNINLKILNQDLVLIDSVNIKNYILSGLTIESNNYCIFSNRETTYFSVVGENKQEEISIPIIPQEINHQSNEIVLIAGNTRESNTDVGLVSFDVNSHKSKIIKRFEGYSIVRGLQSNEKVIAGFIGNISGTFTKYDLFYSTDRGRTWHIKKLEEPNHIRPNFLIDNIMYIYSGGARMQRIIIE